MNRKLECDPLKVVVIGGGIGGLAVALALLQRGFEVDIFEQSAQFKEVGAGINISANGTRVLDALGLKEALARVQVVSSRRNYATGRRARPGSGSSSARTRSSSVVVATCCCTAGTYMAFSSMRFDD